MTLIQMLIYAYMIFSTMRKIFSRAHSAPSKNASCPPNPVIPTVRLQGRDWLFGFAPASSTNTTRGFFYIARPSEAQLSYILGSEWRSLIITKEYPKTDSHMRPISGQVVTSQYIARPDDEDDEAEHCLRMRRCGAVFVTGLDQMRALTEHNANGGAPFGLQEIERHIFGWPETGGVWIYRIPQEVFAAHDANISGTGPLYLRPDNYEDVVAAVGNLKINIKKQEDMQQVVNLLKDAGASFYDEIEDCPEVVKLKLVTPTKNGEEIIPPSDQLHDTWLIQ